MAFVTYVKSTKVWFTLSVLCGVLFIITTSIFYYAFLNPCQAKEDTTSCADGVEAFLAIPIILWYCLLGTSGITVTSYTGITT